MQISKRLLTLILSLFGVLVLILTNPSEETHKAAVRTKFNVLMQSAFKDLSDPKAFDQNLVQGLGFALGGSMLDGIVNSSVSRTNFLLFSTTNIISGNESKTIGFGVLGNVFLSGKVDEALKAATDTKGSDKRLD